MNAELKTAFPFQSFKLAYETHAHKQVFTANYDVCLAIPVGKKNFMWITNDDVCYLVDKTGVYFTKTDLVTDGLRNTVFYGTTITNFFILEDLYYYRGKTTATYSFKERLEIMLNALQTGFVYDCEKQSSLSVVFPIMSCASVNNSLFNVKFWDSLCTKAAYAVHHLQYRASTLQLPYLNQTTAIEVVEMPTVADYYVYYTPCSALSQKTMAALKEAVFYVQADIQDDVYHLFAYDPKSCEKRAYIDIAFIATLKNSIFMNKQFRKIRENDNVELGEESDDETMFQNVQPDKYVDLKKIVKMRCRYIQKWRKWAPIAVATDKEHVVPIYALTGL